MKYYLIAGEASGDLHASHLIKALREADATAAFRFIGGDNMSAAAGKDGVMLKHYKELAYMGFIPVITHLPTIMKGMKMCKNDIMEWQPDVVILVDYAGFNLSIAKYLKKQKKQGRLSAKTFYYIAPKLWAWKEHRIKNIKRDVDELFSILPFEKEFFEGKHGYPIHYVGNPTADEVREFRQNYTEDLRTFCLRTGISANKPIIALLAGSRKQEISANLPTMIESIIGEPSLADYQMVIAGAPGIDPDFYAPYITGKPCSIVYGETYPLLSHTTAALVTSGTATLETALFGVPQVVCYHTGFAKLARWGFDHILKVDYISLVNLIAGSEVVPELFADRFSAHNIREALKAIMPGSIARETMLKGYNDVAKHLGDTDTPKEAARVMMEKASIA